MLNLLRDAIGATIVVLVSAAIAVRVRDDRRVRLADALTDDARRARSTDRVASLDARRAAAHPFAMTRQLDQL